MKTLVGGREQIASCTLLIPEGEDAWIEFDAGTWHIRINVVPVEDKSEPAAVYRLDGKEDHAVLTIKNWNFATPATTEKLEELGRTNGRIVEFGFSGYSMGKMKRFDFSFFWGKQNG